MQKSFHPYWSKITTIGVQTLLLLSVLLTDSFVSKKFALTKDLLTTGLESQVLHVHLNSHAVQKHDTYFLKERSWYFFVFLNRFVLYPPEIPTQEDFFIQLPNLKLFHQKCFCKLHLYSAGPYFQLQSDVRSILLTTYEKKMKKRGCWNLKFFTGWWWNITRWSKSKVSNNLEIVHLNFS